MNWYKKAENLFKIASVIIGPADSSEVYQPMNLSDLHSNLDKALYPEAKRAFDSVGDNKEKYRAASDSLFSSTNMHAYESTDPNEDSGYYAATGHIRLMSYPPIDPDHLSEVIDKWVDHWELVDDDDHQPGEEFSKDEQDVVEATDDDDKILKIHSEEPATSSMQASRGRGLFYEMSMQDEESIEDSVGAACADPWPTNLDVACAFLDAEDVELNVHEPDSNVELLESNFEVALDSGAGDHV